MFHSLRFRLATWLACLVMVMNALAPLVAHAMARTRGEQALLMAVCTAEGTRQRWIDGSARADNSRSKEKPAGMHTGECPYCTPSTDTAAPPPAARFAMPVPSLRDGPPARFYAAHDALFAWTAASPRGPPQVS